MLTARRFNKLLPMIRRYERESQRCADARAYYGACVLLAAALEGSLLGMCAINSDEVQNLLPSLPSAERPRGRVEQWDLSELLTVATHLGWLPRRSSPRGRRKIGDLAELVRELRNLVHPGKHLRDYPNVRVGKGHYRDARAIFEAAREWLVGKVIADLQREIEEWERTKRRPRTTRRSSGAA
jgi:hypothetical protein